jgi:DNA-binding FadR family transcriptional regulator
MRSTTHNAPGTPGRPRLHEEIVRNLCRRILTGDLAPGDKLPPEREMAARMQVNRGTVREALRKLESLELTGSRQGDGIYVRDYLESGNLELISFLLNLGAPPDMDVVDNILELRRQMVPDMAAAAATRRKAAHVAALEAVIADRTLSLREKDIRLHHLIARASGNILYVITLNFFYRLSREILGLYFDNAETVKNTEKFHGDIVRSIRDKKPLKAKQTMNRILRFAEQRIREALDRENRTGT